MGARLEAELQISEPGHFYTLFFLFFSFSGTAAVCFHTYRRPEAGRPESTGDDAAERKRVILLSLFLTVAVIRRAVCSSVTKCLQSSKVFGMFIKVDLRGALKM